MKKYITIFLLSVLFMPSTASASLDANLYYGLTKNTNVVKLQTFLIGKGFLTASPTGNFLSLTLKAVKAYQKSVGIISTGYVGILTRKAINTELAPSTLSPNQTPINKPGAILPPPPLPAATNNPTVNYFNSYQPSANGTNVATTTDAAGYLQAQIKALQDQLSSLEQQNSQQGIGTLITSFKFAGLNLSANEGIINADHTIVVVVPDSIDMATLIPIIQVSSNATVSPASGVMQDFTGPVTYTVANMSGATQDYIVIVVTEGSGG